MAAPDDIGRSFRFVKEDLLDLPRLVDRLRESEEPVSRYLKQGFKPETRKLLEASHSTGPDAADVRDALIVELNGIIRKGAIYNEERFAGVELSGETRRALSGRPEGAALVRLNVLLLEDAYQTELLRNFSSEPKFTVERVQTGMRIEKRMLKVLKGLAEAHELSLGELVEDIVLHAFAGASTYDSPVWLERIAALKKVYGMDYDAHAARRFSEPSAD